MRFWVIGTDGGLLDAPVSTTSIRMAAAERADLLVDFSGLDPHTSVELRNDETVPGQAAILGEVPMPVFCRFRAGSGAGFRGEVPARLRGGRRRPPRLAAPQRPQHVRNLTIGQPSELRMPPSIMLLNNIMFTSDQIEMPRQGSVEQWNLINLTPDPHPIHLHLVMFRVLGRQSFDAEAYQLHHPRPPTGTKWNPSAGRFLTGKPRAPEAWESGRKDTVLADGHTVTSIVVRFPTAEELGFDPDATFPAPAQHGKQLQGYMWHCHVLDHEDHDMMLRYRTIPA